MKRLLVVCGVVLIVPVLVVVAEFREKPLRHGLADVGCRSVSVRHDGGGARSVLLVSVHDCLDEAGRAVSAVEAWDRIARVAWEMSASRFDGVVATVFRTAEDPGATREISREFFRAELEARWGPRPVMLDWGLPDPRRDEWFLLLAVPALLVVVGAPVALGVFAARRGVFVFWWRS